MFCSVTVSVTPIVAASHAARALRLPASPLGVLPSKSGLLRVLDVGKLEAVQHTPFPSQLEVSLQISVEALLN
jgi:hypothetical protein